MDLIAIFIFNSIEFLQKIEKNNDIPLIEGENLLCFLILSLLIAGLKDIYHIYTNNKVSHLILPSAITCECDRKRSNFFPISF
jgi:hypothetical protein